MVHATDALAIPVLVSASVIAATAPISARFIVVSLVHFARAGKQIRTIGGPKIRRSSGVRDLALERTASGSEGAVMATWLSIDVFNSGYEPVPGGPGWDDGIPATWPA
jgi:hypothetical protein